MQTQFLRQSIGLMLGPLSSSVDVETTYSESRLPALTSTNLPTFYGDSPQNRC